AEDGIRDSSVTGVQTCALPISEDEAAGVLSDLIFSDRAFTLRRAEFHASQEPAKILVTFARFGEEGIANACCGSDFSADMRLERSEERRVGKEGRRRVWRGDEE